MKRIAAMAFVAVLASTDLTVRDMLVARLSSDDAAAMGLRTGP